MATPRIYVRRAGTCPLATRSGADVGLQTVYNGGPVPAETLLGGGPVATTGPMYRHGHYGVALLVSAPVGSLLGPAAGPAFSLVAVATSMLPDWDTRTTRVRHRGVTHTVGFAVVAAVGAGLLATAGWLVVREVAPAAVPSGVPPAEVGPFVAAGTFLGVASHLLADALNPGYGTNAMRPLWPASRRVVRWGIARVDSPAWNWGLLVVGSLAQVAALSLASGLG